MVRILPTRYADVPNAHLLADCLRQIGTLTMDNFADWVERLPDDDKRIMRLQFARCFDSGRCVLGEAAHRCVESWRGEGMHKGHSELMDDLAAAARVDWVGPTWDGEIRQQPDAAQEPEPPDSDAA